MFGLLPWTTSEAGPDRQPPEKNRKRADRLDLAGSKGTTLIPAWTSRPHIV
jgi:hypothetical protein